MFFSIEDILDKEQVTYRARERWNEMTVLERLRQGQKYKHVPIPNNKVASWVQEFCMLDEPNQNILIKGELIRTYDAMLISDKRKLCSEAMLSKFQTKWFKLTNDDKTKLLDYVLSKHNKNDNTTRNNKTTD